MIWCLRVCGGIVRVARNQRPWIHAVTDILIVRQYRSTGLILYGNKQPGYFYYSLVCSFQAFISCFDMDWQPLAISNIIVTRDFSIYWSFISGSSACFDLGWYTCSIFHIVIAVSYVSVLFWFVFHFYGPWFAAESSINNITGMPSGSLLVWLIDWLFD